MNDNRKGFPKPVRFAIYLLLVTVAGFVNWKMTYANDPGMNSASSFDPSLIEALAPIPDPEPELEAWLLSFSENFTETGAFDNSLETRVAEALEPVPDPEPELEEWILNLSEDILEGTSL